MGIDPGIRELSFVVLEDEGRFVCSSELEVRAGEGEAIRERLLDELVELTSHEWMPGVKVAVIACEGVYVGGNLRLAVQLGELQGLIHAVAILAGVPFVEIAPAQGRKALTGNGAAADRRALQCAWQLSGNRGLTIHQADALGVALAALEITDKYLEEEVEE